MILLAKDLPEWPSVNRENSSVVGREIHFYLFVRLVFILWFEQKNTRLFGRGCFLFGLKIKPLLFRSFSWDQNFQFGLYGFDLSLEGVQRGFHFFVFSFQSSIFGSEGFDLRLLLLYSIDK